MRSIQGINGLVGSRSLYNKYVYSLDHSSLDHLFNLIIELRLMWSVLAFVGPPSSFPVEEQNAPLQKYLVWQDELLQRAKDFIDTLPKGPYVGIHLRNGADWVSRPLLINLSKNPILLLKNVY
jgi:hypothetical protein